VPTSPTNFTATAGDQQASFRWTAVSGATRYVVVLKPANASCVTVATSCAVQGLTNDTTYTATAYAVNGDGMSAPSAPRTVTPTAMVPSAPRGVSAVAFGRHVRVMWSAALPQSNPVTSYTVTAAPGGDTCTTNTTSCVISDLQPGTAYTFTVTATNAVGTSSSSDPSNSVTITDLPSAPTNIVLTPAPQEIGVSWDASASNGGLAIDSYRATAYLASSGAPVGHCLATGATSCVIANLNTATSYVVRVLAHNAEGYSVASVTAGPVTTGFYVPGVPQKVVVTGAPASIQVAWNIPVSDGGGAITGYTVTSSGSPARTCTTTGATKCSMSGLTNGVPYTFTVRATNAVGIGLTSSPSAAVTPSMPIAPTPSDPAPAPAPAPAPSTPSEPSEPAPITGPGLPQSRDALDWGIDRLDQRSRTLDGRFAVPLDGTGVTAYVVDTGVMASHEEFTGRVIGGVDLNGRLAVIKMAMLPFHILDETKTQKII
jgi:hypothetical protein